MALRQTLNLKMLQKLSPQQIQLMKLLQVPTVAIEARIKEELERNPALEEGRDAEEDEFGKVKRSTTIRLRKQLNLKRNSIFRITAMMNLLINTQPATMEPMLKINQCLFLLGKLLANCWKTNWTCKIWMKTNT